MPAAKKKQADPCDDWEDVRLNRIYSMSRIGDFDHSETDLITPPRELLSTRILIVLIYLSFSADLPCFLLVNPSPNVASDPVEIENSAMWNNANRNPQYVVLPANAAHSAVTANRPLVQDTMFGKAKVTILKRPKAESMNQSSSHSNSSSSSNLSISLREKAYSEARERIFGSASGSDDQSSSKPLKISPTPPQISRDSSSANMVVVQRQPSGPVSSDQKGFNSRQKYIPT
ncbi:hypothetical protein PTTG_00327 [Puccinia triticina 1-1 BBBD Race 1]|uniref:SUZ domain-containing protein n=1 Tax=Puccinia triticina (isolate 1-1 / race 1 (BBBD)) TaxID=630390 RepID=A0A180GZX1_PUCT1|nr:hypothetical protein PTTG_00327 [Puccinia triticina 1-1 BBBD Race 1]